MELVSQYRKWEGKVSYKQLEMEICIEKGQAKDAIKLRDLQFYCAPFFLYIFKPIYTFKFTILCLYLYINIVIPVENYAYISLYVFSHVYKLYSFRVIKTDLSIFIPYALNYIFIPNILLSNLFLTLLSFIEIIRLFY